MKKKIILSLLLLLSISSLTGCNSSNKLEKTNVKETPQETEKEDKNTLVCTSNSISLGSDMYISKKSIRGELDKNPENCDISFSTGNKDIEKGEYKFIYENNHLNMIKGKETYNKSFSSSVTNEQIEETNSQDNFKASKKDGKIIFEYRFSSDDNDDFIKALDAQYPTKEELKAFLEEGNYFTCK